MRLPYSLTMGLRNRCKHCKSCITYFFYIAAKGVQSEIKRIPQPREPSFDVLLRASPKDFKCNFGYSLQSFRGWSPKYRQYLKNRFTSGKMPVEVGLICGCGKSIWYVANEKKKSKADRYFEKGYKYLL